jgi:methylmalonyl-CoA/ethylmalonyl-CoA epimerase
MPASFLGPIFQVAWITANIDKAMENWMQAASVGPWMCFKNVEMQGTLYGTPITVRMHAAMSYRNGQQIELIQPVGGSPSPYVDGRGQPLLGLHHTAWYSEDLEADIAEAKRRGIEPFFRAENPATKVCYLQVPGEMGAVMELIQVPAEVMEGFRQGMAASANWDGKSNAVTVIDFSKM